MQKSLLCTVRWCNPSPVGCLAFGNPRDEAASCSSNIGSSLNKAPFQFCLPTLQFHSPLISYLLPPRKCEVEWVLYFLPFLDLKMWKNIILRNNRALSGHVCFHLLNLTLSIYQKFCTEPSTPLSDFEIPAKCNLDISQKLARSHPSKLI